MDVEAAIYMNIEVHLFMAVYEPQNTAIYE